MNIDDKEISEEKLNLFIDVELESEEMDIIRQALLDDKGLRERVCQLKAVRELIGYAYSNVPTSRYDEKKSKKKKSFFSGAIAASVLLVTGVILGWSTYQYSPNALNAISAENTFQYVANHVAVDHSKRKIILHIDSGDLQIVSAALNEVDHLLATYREANTPMQLEVVANKTGINMLRPDISPYIARIQKLIKEESVSFYACERSINKAHKKEGVEIVLLPDVKTNKTAREIIPDRLEKGWVYIKA